MMDVKFYYSPDEENVIKFREKKGDLFFAAITAYVEKMNISNELKAIILNKTIEKLRSSE